MTYISFLAAIRWRCRPISNSGSTFPKANASCCRVLLVLYLGFKHCYMLLLKFKAAYIVHYRRLEMVANPIRPGIVLIGIGRKLRYVRGDRFMFSTQQHGSRFLTILPIES